MRWYKRYVIKKQLNNINAVREKAESYEDTINVLKLLSNSFLSALSIRYLDTAAADTKSISLRTNNVECLFLLIDDMVDIMTRGVTISGNEFSNYLGEVQTLKLYDWFISNDGYIVDYQDTLEQLSEKLISIINYFSQENDPSDIDYYSRKFYFIFDEITSIIIAILECKLESL
ncbi:hypothetical protein [Proteus mirabilis]|uniref:hypothetical protein n=1 Tax=Proteus mirabilis TaxID=584 RepID=UPI0034D6B7BB